MLLQLVESLRRWESHCMGCQQCDRYDKSSPAWLEQNKVGVGPCGVGRAIILNIIKVLEGGL